MIAHSWELNHQLIRDEGSLKQMTVLELEQPDAGDFGGGQISELPVSYYYTKQGYAIVAHDGPSTHYFGGSDYYEGAVCPVCRIPLLLLVDLDCRSIRLFEQGELFRKLDRLPLYYCWRCCAEKLSYQVSNSSLKIFKNDGKPQDADFPYTDFPTKFEKRTIKLVPIPYEAAKLLAVAQEIDSRWLTQLNLTTIQIALKNLRHSSFSKSCFNRHQIGGLLNLVQGHEYVVCPNPTCEHHKLAKQGCGTRMKELAVVHNDPYSGLPMSETLNAISKPSDFNEFIQVVYWICEHCLTISASNRCD